MPITELEHTVIINRPVKEVFDFISLAENMPRWAEKVTKAAQTSEGPVNVGTTCYVVSRGMGKEIRQDFVVTECKPGRTYAAKSTAGPVPVETKYALEPVNEGTRLHAYTSADLGGLMSLAGPFLNRKLKKQFEADHQELKRLLESQRDA